MYILLISAKNLFFIISKKLLIKQILIFDLQFGKVNTEILCSNIRVLKNNNCLIK